MNILALLMSSVALAQAAEEEALAVVAAPAAPDRSQPPAVAPPVPLDLPSPTLYALRPGVTVEHLQVPGVRKVHVNVLFHHGSVALCGAPLPPCTLLSQIWDVAGSETGAEELESTFDRLDGGLLSWINRYDAGFELTIPRARWDEGLALMAEVLHEPGFPKKDLKRSQRDLRDWYTVQAPSDLGTVASMARLHATYPPDHPRGTRPDLDALASVKVGELRALHSRLLSEVPVTVEVFGDVTWEEVSADVTALVEGIGAAGERAVPPPFTPISKAQIVAVDMPGQPQAAIRVTTPAPDRASADRVAMSGVNFALGGSFTSRLNGNLREEKGWTYGAYSGYSSLLTHGAWSASVDVEAENVAATVGEIQAELAAMVADGPTAEEINAAWLDDVTWWNRRLETDATVDGFYQMLTRQEESVDDVAARLAAMHELQPAEAQAVSDRWLGADAPMLWVIVGDRSAIGEQVESLGLPTTWISATEAIMGTFTVAR